MLECRPWDAIIGVPLLPRSTGYVFLVLFTLSVFIGGADAAMVLCCTVQAGLLVLAQRRAETRVWVLPVQALVTYLPIAFVTGGSGAHQGALLAATVLWCLPARLRWIAFAVVVVGAGFAHTSWRHEWPAFLYGVLTTTAVGIVMYSLMLLPALVDRLTSTQDELARVTLARERLRVARRLRAAVGDQLTAVMELLKSARHELVPQPERARETVVEAARATRDMTETVRQTAALHRTIDVLPRDNEPVARLAPRLTLFALASSLLVWTVNQVLESANYRVAIGVGGAVISILLLAQLLRPRIAAPLLAVQAAVALIPLPWLGASWCVWLILLAAAVLLTQRGSWVLPAVVGLIALRAVYIEPTERLAMRAGWVILAMEAMLVLFGLARFWQLSDELIRSRAELVRMTLQVERLRVARDIHDLLGLTLSVLALKTDLIVELIARDAGRAAAEIDESLRIAGEARIEARAMVDEHPSLSLRHELHSAGKALAVDGTIVKLECDDDFPERAGAVLAPVVREAITNALRHSAATKVGIECRQRNEFLHLIIRNDGIGVTTGSGGQGLSNMRARVIGAGGSFAASFRAESSCSRPGSPSTSMQNAHRSPSIMHLLSMPSALPAIPLWCEAFRCQQDNIHLAAGTHHARRTDPPLPHRSRSARRATGQAHHTDRRNPQRQPRFDRNPAHPPRRRQLHRYLALGVRRTDARRDRCLPGLPAGGCHHGPDHGCHRRNRRNRRRALRDTAMNTQTLAWPGTRLGTLINSIAGETWSARLKFGAYAVTTGIVLTESVVGSYWDLARTQYVVDTFADLEYPMYFATILGVSKLLAVGALVVPRFPRLKEWAYAGLVFVYAGASASHFAVGDPASKWIGPLFFTAFTLVSWSLRKPARSSVSVQAQPVSD